MSVLWNVILTRYNDISLKFVHCTCDLKLAADLLESLHTFIDDYRNRFDEFEAKAKKVSSVSDVHSCFSKQRTRHFDEVEESAVVLQGRDKFRVETFLVIVNQLQTALRGRLEACCEVHKHRIQSCHGAQRFD